MVPLRGWPLLALGTVGFLGGFFYCGWPIHFKYRGLGEVGIFALFGPLMVIGSYYVLTGSFHRDVLIISLPVGFLVAAIVHANNLRDIADDRVAGVTTASSIFGQAFAAIEYYALLAGAYGSVAVMILLGILPISTLVVALSIPPAAKIVKRIAEARGKRTAHLAAIDQMTAQVHLLFGLLLMAGILAGKLLS
jgi:1,4-dihydroxy-2-naphthoate octaprenyltransferase